MKVVELVGSPMNVELTEPFGIATGSAHFAANVAVRVRLDDGTEGLGEAAPFPAVNGETQSVALEAVGRAASFVLGKSPESWKEIARALKGAGLAASARCGVESALVDALCRARGESLLAMFGGAERAIETDITIPTGHAEHARESARRAAAAGFRTLKVKVGASDVWTDCARVRAVASVAPEARIVLDANAAMSVRRALELVDRLERAGTRIELFEQPTPAGDLDGLAEVQRAVPVAADESAQTAADVLRIAERRAAEVVNVKITKCGIVEALDMVACAKERRLRLMIGGMVESKICMGVSACLAAGLGGFDFVDLDTPLFMKGSPVEGGWAGDGPHIDLTPITLGHGAELRR